MRSTASRTICRQTVANLLDVAGLLLAQEVAGAAQVEIVACELKSGAQHVERLQHGEPLLRLRRDLGFGRDRERGVGTHLRATEAAAQLVELREANMSARCTIIVLARGMSRPDFMIAVDSRMSYLPS